MNGVSNPPAPAGVAVPLAPVLHRSRQLLAPWLLACAGLVVVVLVLGGITRLTRSGLSIVQWQPIAGAFPPVTEADWQLLFQQYRSSPEFEQVNSGITIEGFRTIFWWEYAHRLAGRIAGLAFLLPLLWFAFAGVLSRALFVRLAGIFLLGAVQGVAGWWMVRSGLVEDPSVSPFRLALHLGLALAILGALLWTSWELRPRPKRPGPAVRFPAVLVLFVVLVAFSGALMAGARAGLAYNTFPLLNGALVPEDVLRLSPWYENFQRNPATIQLLHRALALVLILVSLGAWLRMRATPPRGAPFRTSGWFLLALAVQAGLGAANVLASVPLGVAILHQALAVGLFCLALRLAFLGRPEAAGRAPSG